MRLQLSIHRNTLPLVQIIFTTGTGPSSRTQSRSGSTIADLLHDINELVPLESSDGEWGLEDYVVEVAATVGQEALYECLHFQILDSVLRDDDEVLVRALSSDELRSRRLGGRLQITGDGRHLIDGIVFGKRWMRQQDRPGVIIPPRKKRRLLATEEDDNLLALEQDQLLRAITAADGSDDEDDEDYDDKENVDYDKALAIREDFDDADEETGEENEGVEEDEIQLLLEDAEELGDADIDQAEEVLETQLKARTRLGKRKRDTIDDRHDDSVFEGFSTPIKASKHIHIEIDDDDSSDESNSVVESGLDSDSISREDAAGHNQQIEADIRGSDDEPGTSDSSFDSDTEQSHSNDDESHAELSEEPEEDNISQRARSARKRLGNQNQATSSQQALKKSLFKQRYNRADKSPSENSGSSNETAPSTSSSLTESDFTSSSGSDVTSNSASSSFSESESDSEEATDQPTKTSQAAAADFANKLESLQSASAPSQTVVAETPQSAKSSQLRQQSAPGEGSSRTHKKNERLKMKKKLETLKEAGDLPAHADFSDLRQFEQSQGSPAADIDTLAEDLEAAKARLLNIVESPNDEEQQPKPETGAPETSQIEPQGKEDVNLLEALTVETALANNTIAPSELIAENIAPKRSSLNDDLRSTFEPPAKRAKLDVAASRRLLFGSLGLRTPKTRAEEEALREKLGKQARTSTANDPKDKPSTATSTFGLKQATGQSWQDKLIMSAVECVRDGVVLPPPPFPFVQNWHKKGRNNPTPVHNTLHYDGSVSPPIETERRGFDSGFAPDVSTMGIPSVEDNVSHAESRTLSFDKESDGMPIPTDFAALAELDRSHLIKGAVVAYKEVYVGAETNFQPEISPYRVAQVGLVDTDGFVTLILSKQDRRKPIQRDRETGETVSNNFEITGTQDEEDNGVRELEFAFMLEPKLVEAAKVQVPESTASSSLRGGDGDATSQPKSDAVVPESIEEEKHHGNRKTPPTKIVVEQVEIDTPRRKEITTMIKEAGSESAVDENLFKPLPADQNESVDGSQPVQEDEQNSIISDGLQFHDDQGHEQQASAELQDSHIETSKFVLEKSKIDDWSSSPLFPATNGDTGVEVNGRLESRQLRAEPPSSPPVSPQLTVEYPHISQMGLRSSAAPLDESTRQSSHQDAQQIPAVPAGDLVSATSTREQEREGLSEGIDFHDDDELASLQSEVPQTQSQEQQDDDDEGDSHSFLGKPGYDGHASSYHESDDDPNSSDSESSLPSLRELTSSQKRKIATTSTKSKKLSPPLLNRNRLRNTKTRKPPISAVDGGADDDNSDDFAFSAPSQPVIKVSASQVEKPRALSQIPLGTQVVDLTMSSDPVSPDNSDGEYGVMRPRRARRSGHTNGGAKPKTRASTLGASVSDTTGIGTKRFLTTKKTRSQATGGEKGGDYF